jgi:hypothetical protein
LRLSIDARGLDRLRPRISGNSERLRSAANSGSFRAAPKGGACFGADQIRQTGNADKSIGKLGFAANRDAKLFFDANGEFDSVKGVEAQVAADERLVIGDPVRLQHVKPDYSGDKVLQLH